MEIEIKDGKVVLNGSDRYWSGYEYGSALDSFFPDADTYNFGACIAENGSGPISATNSVVGLELTTEGENDGPAWIWTVQLEDGSTWQLEGWCDYTGWDCQSGSDWEKIL